MEKIFETSKIDTEVNELYSDISKDTKEFIIFTSKVYQVLLKKVKDNKYNEELKDTIIKYYNMYFITVSFDQFGTYTIWLEFSLFACSP